MQNVPREHSVSIVSGYVTADRLMKCVINRQGNVSLVADLVLLALIARFVSFVYSHYIMCHTYIYCFLNLCLYWW